MFRIFPENLKIPFMSLRYVAGVLSVALIAGSIYFLSTKGLNFGVDFAGGIQMVLKFPSGSGVDAEKLRANLKNIGIEDASVQSFGTEFEEHPSEYIVHFSSEFADDTALESKVEEILGGDPGAPEEERLVSNLRFSGIEKAYFRLNKEVSIEEIRSQFESADFGMLQLEAVAPFGRASSREYEIRFQSISANVAASLEEEFSSTDADSISIEKVDFVGAKVGADLKTSALLSILVTIFLVFVYIFLRFDLIYAPGVILALAHDVLITTGIFSLLGVEFDLTVIAALLTVAGYSINDTIIVYDRIREVAAELKGKGFKDILDLAINQTLNRTVITSGTTMAATGILWVFGGPVIHSFAFALCIGILVGTYSSIFVAAALVLYFDNWQKKRSSGSKKKAAA